MNLNKKALRLIREALREKVKGLAVEANLADHYGADHPAALQASKKRKDFQWILNEINQELQSKEAHAKNL